MEISPSLENYLESVYMLEREAAPVRVTDVATRLSVSKASVNRAMTHLKEAGLLKQEYYGTLTLTEPGREHASEVARRHVLLKGFLVDVLGIAPDVAETDACKMEHVVSAETMRKWTGYMQRLRDRGEYPSRVEECMEAKDGAKEA